MEHKILVLCDLEADYAELMSTYLRKSNNFPWEIYVYTNPSELKEIDSFTIDILLISESAYFIELENLFINKIILLNETGTLKWKNIININKYQQAENILKELLQIYVDQENIIYPSLERKKEVEIIGFYSPIRQCLQTTFSLTLGQILASKYTTLYLNFEHFVGLQEIIPTSNTTDLGALLYFVNNDSERFSLRMRTMVQKIGELEYIAPMINGQNLIYVTINEWKELLLQIIKLGEYDYIILDLSENMQGLFELLQMCKSIFTITKEDQISQCKIRQYEQLLLTYQLNDIMEKTNRYTLPYFRKIPSNIEQYTKGELAEYINNMLKKEGWITS